jgi:hypothetical protein
MGIPRADAESAATHDENNVNEAESSDIIESLGELKPGSYNKSKIAYLNSEDGKRRRGRFTVGCTHACTPRRLL